MTRILGLSAALAAADSSAARPIIRSLARRIGARRGSMFAIGKNPRLLKPELIVRNLKNLRDTTFIVCAARES